MKDIGPIFRALTRNKLGAMLIALQIALTLAIVTNAAYIISERAENIARPSGLDEANTALFITNLFDSNVDQRQLYRDDLDAIRSIPGVLAASPAQSIPISGSGWGEDLYNDPEMPSNESINFGNFMVDEHGLETFGLELVAGRNFRPEEVKVRSFDDMDLPDNLIVSQALADELFPDGDALDKTVWDEPNGERPMRIIGIYDHMQNAWPTSSNVNNTALLPSIAMFGGQMMYVVRSEPGQLQTVMTAVEEYLAGNRSRIVDIVRSYEEQKRRTYSGDIAMVKLLSVVIATLAGVTGLGIVGLAWFSVTQRQKQIGTRRALGATRKDIISYFMVENWLITTAGLAIGLVGTLALNWFLDTQYEVGRVPLWYLPLGVVALWTLGLVAVLLPARRAANIPPALATRSV
ncbi:MAG: FtsX-like permease family protein [Gammaproteobacteria bacterium]|jgi:putative ABC transport system permease protein|nr:FtsX-like permease family protein [Gammaproteobacteria bacterium]